MNRWQIGDVRVTRIVEMEVVGGTRFILPQATPEAVLPMQWLVPHFATPEGKLIMSVHALVIETSDRLMLVDTCIGNDKIRSVPNWHQLSLPFLEDLAKAGYEPEQFDTIMCTHLHVDHVGWNTRLVDGVWVPTFKNARYLIGKAEYQYWQTAKASDLNDDIFEDSVMPVVNAGLVDLVASDHQVSSDVSFISTPGHTPGHTSFLLSSAGEHLLLVGDAAHHPEHLVHHDWVPAVDNDPAETTRSRRRIVDLAIEKDAMVTGGHFPILTVGKLSKINNEVSFLEVDINETDVF